MNEVLMAKIILFGIGPVGIYLLILFQTVAKDEDDMSFWELMIVSLVLFVVLASIGGFIFGIVWSLGVLW